MSRFCSIASCIDASAIRAFRIIPSEAKFTTTSPRRSGTVCGRRARRSVSPRVVVRLGSDPYASTARRLIIAASVLARRHVGAQEVWDVGEDAPVASAGEIPPRPVISAKLRMALKKYSTPLDLILRREGLFPYYFAEEAGMARQSLQRLRAGTRQPCMSTIAQIVCTLRRLTGKPYKAQHVFDLGETLDSDDPITKWLHRSRGGIESSG